MKIVVTIETGNAAFEDNPVREAERIISGWGARSVLSGEILPGPLFDANGNTCGEVEVTA